MKPAQRLPLPLLVDVNALHMIWDTRGYFFWLLAVSTFVLVLERLWPWRRNQRLLRRQFGQDVFWLFFNGHYAGVLLASIAAWAFAWLSPTVEALKDRQMLANQPLWVQFAVFFVAKDFMEWGVHNALHRVRWLWAFHKVHHTIQELDWIGNLRFHWMEIVVYRGVTYLPLVALGVDARVILWIAVVSTLIGHLNHSNLNLTWGPLRYVFNSPRMHVWHHDRNWPPGRNQGVNFGIALSAWDWLFKTAWWPSIETNPSQQPQELGFEGQERFPKGILGRLGYPLRIR